jgi:hypothetical protein
MLRDQRERERREARAAAAMREATTPSPDLAASSPMRNMPGTGRSLVAETPDSPPANHEDGMEDDD